MLDLDIGEDRAGRVEIEAVAVGEVGLALEDALIGEDSTGVDIDADKGGLGGGGDRESSKGVIAEDVDAEPRRGGEGGREGALDRDDHASHRGDGVGRNAVRVEGGIAKVFDDHRVKSSVCQGQGIADRGLFDRKKIRGRG